MVSVIINRAAGKDRRELSEQQLAERFRVAGLQTRITLTAKGEDIAQLVRRAVDSGSSIVVGGGDGTLNRAASVLVGSERSLGILPLGTMNHFAKDLGIPLEIDEAIQVIAAGQSACIDTGEVNGKLFLNNSSLGLYPEIVRERQEQQRRLGRGKWLAFVSTCLTALRRFPFMTVSLTANGEKRVIRTAFVFIGNNQYSIDGFDIGERQQLDGGRLCLCVGHRVGRFDLLRLALRALFGRLRQAKDFDLLDTSEVLIESQHQQLDVATDGEVARLKTPLAYRIRPLSLRVLVPGKREQGG